MTLIVEAGLSALILSGRRHLHSSEIITKSTITADVVIYSYTPSTEKPEAGGSQVWGQNIEWDAVLKFK